MTTDRKRLRALASDLAGLRANRRNITGPIGYILGATYALILADRLGFVGGRVKDREYVVELRSVATAIASGLSPRSVTGVRIVGGSSQRRAGAWLAGMYFNTALHRIAASAERLGIHPKKGSRREPHLIGRIRREVNKLKHLMEDRPRQMSKGLLTGRRIEKRNAIKAVELLVDLCKQRNFLKQRAG